MKFTKNSIAQLFAKPTAKIDQTFRLRQKGNAQRGAGILSVLLGIVVTGALIYVIVDQYNSSSGSARQQAAISEITTMAAKVQQSYGAANQYGAVTTAVAVNGGAAGAMRVAGTSTAQNRYNGAVTFTPATLTIANDSLVIGYDAVRQDDCQAVVLGLTKSARQIQVAGADVQPADLPVDVGALSTQCNSAATVKLDVTVGRT